MWQKVVACTVFLYICMELSVFSAGALPGQKNVGWTCMVTGF